MRLRPPAAHLPKSAHKRPKGPVRCVRQRGAGQEAPENPILHTFGAPLPDSCRELRWLFLWRQSKVAQGRCLGEVKRGVDALLAPNNLKGHRFQQ